MDLPLTAAALAMGLAATPHCALMCGAPCAALTAGCQRSAAGFHLGRWAGYMAGGALAAASVSALGAWSQSAPVLRPLWTLVHLALLVLGAFWLTVGTSPRWMRRSTAVVVRVVGGRHRPLRTGLAGLAWVAWPCGALQAALLLAALASSAASGALVMAAFAAASTPGLLAAPWAWMRLRRARAGATSSAALEWRIPGLGLVLASGWALTHGLWERIAAYCAA